MDVDVTNKRDVWLVKVPKYLANTWKNAPQKADLGKLVLPKGGIGPIKFVIDPKIQAQANKDSDEKFPSEHMLSLNPLLHQRMVIMSQNKNGETSSSSNSGGEKVSFEGDVKQRGELRPVGDMSYMSLKTSSIKQAAKPTRTTQILDRAVTSYKPRGAAQLAHEADLRKKKEEAKKTIRQDKEVVQGILFRAFEKQQYYNIRDLANITNQPLPYLKEILKEMCNYCSKSTHKNMWELKPEYRHY